MEQTLTKNYSALPFTEKWAFKQAGRAQTTALSHAYHRYPAKFIPQIVHELVEQYTSPGDLVFDPFGGCGTTLVESRILRRCSIGFDINPVAVFIAQVKIQEIEPELLGHHINKAVSRFGASKEGDSKKEHHKKIGYWFDDLAVDELERLYASIITTEDRVCRNFMLCAFSHILKNCSRWLMKSTKPTIHRDKKPQHALDAFLKQIHMMEKRNKQYYEVIQKNELEGISAKAEIHDSTKLFPISERSVDLIVTSPPYVTSYEYADLHQLTLLWLSEDKENFNDWAQHVADYEAFRKEFIGTNLNNGSPADISVDVSSIAAAILQDLKERDGSQAKDVSHYFSDMYSALQNSARVLKKNAHISIIIGNTELKGVEILNAEVAGEMLKNLGFTIKEVYKREITNKMIAPWRDINTGQFTNMANPDKKKVYQHEFILVAQNSNH